MVQLRTTKKETEIQYSFYEKSFTWFITPLSTVSPITIACPHDGIRKNDLHGLFPKRKKGCCSTDIAVWQLIKGIAWHTPINMIRGMVPRFMLDYNRYASKQSFRSYARDLFEDTEKAYEEKQLNRYHRAYHQKLISTVLKTKALYGSKAIFFDFHGFINQPTYGNFDLILGTANTHTLRSDRDKQFSEFFRAKGYGVFLPQFRTQPITKLKADMFAAGFTTRNVFLKTGVDSIQVEVHNEIRTTKDRAEKFSADMAEFLMSIH